MILIKRTIYGSALQTAKLIDVPHVIQPNSTLNEKFSVADDFILPDDQVPFLGYYCIGRGGHKNATGPDGAPLMSLVPHQARDAALFEHMPFIMREVTNDLTDAQRANYALRVEQTHDNRQYYAYYLRRLDMSTTIPTVEYTVTTAGNSTTVPFEPTQGDLSPTPVDVPSTGTINTSGDVLSVRAPVSITFDKDDVSELENACEIIYGSAEYAVISEIGLCTGVDVDMPFQPETGSPYTVKEAGAVQVMSHLGCLYVLSFSNNGFDLLLDLGASEPLPVGTQGITVNVV